MKKTYQGRPDKSKAKFEVLGKRELPEDLVARGLDPERRYLFVIDGAKALRAGIERVARNVKRWREGEQALRWRATGLLEAQKKFRRVKGYRELQHLHRRMNPSLTQQAQVA